MFVLALAALGVLLAASVSAQSLRLQVPAALPRGQHLGSYSPWIAVSYADLRSEPYTLKLWLLEENNWHCASTQWCERALALGSQREGNADGSLEMTTVFDVFEYGPSLTWVARLYDGAGQEVASAKARSKTLAARPPELKPVGKRVGVVGQPLRFTLEATPSSRGKAVNFRINNAPLGSKFDAATGLFEWTPDAAGLRRIVVEAVAADTQLADAEIVELDIAIAEEAEAGSPASPKAD